MSRPHSTFRQRDVTAAVRAVEAAGQKVARIEIARDGTIRIITARDETAIVAAERNEWDEA